MIRNYKKIFIIRKILKISAFVFLVLSFFGFSWGTYLVPVQKSSASVAFVFDVSNSMNARDCQNGMSRLEASSIYAEKLLSKMQENGKANVSVILAKGDGINVVPLTEDYEIIQSLLNSLDSSLVSAPGTSLGKGIVAAKNSFSSDFSSANKIWVFTDGEETDGQLSDAMEDCIKSGIPLSIIGFGSETESQVLAGDKKTRISTALRKDRILEAIYQVSKKYPHFVNQAKVIYVGAEEKGSASKLLNQLILPTSSIGEKSDFMAYEAQKVPRFRLFLVIAILLYVASFVITEINLDFFRKKTNKSISLMMIFFACIIFSACGNSQNQNNSQNSLVEKSDGKVASETSPANKKIKSRFDEKKIVFRGVNAFQKKKYNAAISCFMKAEEKARAENNQQLLDYAVFDLATSYIMQNEDKAAAAKFLEISGNAGDAIKYASYYNSGVLAYRNGNLEDAAMYFRKALEIDSSKIEAKVNLELSSNQIEVNARQNESKINKIQENDDDFSDEESSIFEHIKENDKNQWKSLRTEQNADLANDY